MNYREHHDCMNAANEEGRREVIRVIRASASFVIN